MAWLPEWRRLLELGATEAFTAHCLLPLWELTPEGVPLPFRSALILLRSAGLALVTTLTCAFRASIPRLRPSMLPCSQRPLPLSLMRLYVSGTLLVDSFLSGPMVWSICLQTTLLWTEGKSWHWQGRSHVNILESAALLRLCQCLAKRGPRRKIAALASPQACTSPFISAPHG